MGKLQRIALFAVLGLVLLYAADYVMLRARGQALGSVDVQIMWAVKQKDNRIDYQLGDTETRPCVHSLFPQMGYAPCWYLSRHKNQTITVGSIPRRLANMAQTLLSAAARTGPEIDLSQFRVAHPAPFGRGSVSAHCVSEPRPQGAGCGPIANSTTIRRSAASRAS